MFDENIFMLAIAAVFISVVISLTLIMLRRQETMRQSLAQREQILLRLTDRFEASEDFIAFASSPDAERLFQTQDGPTAIARRLLALTASAIVIAAVGIAFLINSYAPLPSQDINFIREAQEARWWAVMFLAMGAGLGIAAALCTRMARRWGILSA